MLHVVLSFSSQLKWSFIYGEHGQTNTTKQKQKGSRHFNATSAAVDKRAWPVGLTSLRAVYLSCFYVYQGWESQITHIWLWERAQ